MIDLRGAVAVFFGGGCGSVLRYLVGMAFVQRFGPGFPYGTLCINVIGCFVIGLISQLALARALGVTPSVRVFAAVGLMGGFTTFSSFAYETVTLGADERPFLALLYVTLSVGAGVVAAFAGTLVGRIAS